MGDNKLLELLYEVKDELIKIAKEKELFNEESYKNNIYYVNELIAAATFNRG